MPRVVALDDGHDGREFRRRGQQWDVPDGVLGKDGKPADGRTWFCAVDKAPPPPAVVKNPRPPGSGPAKGSAAPAPGEASPSQAGTF